jgi:peptidoglycan/LPS O-acetylase OafA/YrhL
VAPRLGYVPALDGLRGIAIVLVVTVHYFGVPLGAVHGVDLFFVLSGFLITTLLLEERAHAGRISLRKFYERRSRRLLPALAVVLGVFLALGGTVTTMALGGLYIGNVVQEFGISPSVHYSAMNPFWSLAQEEQFYLVWPLLLIVLTRSRRFVPLLTTLIAALVAYRVGLALAGASSNRLYYGPDTHSDGLLAGALLAALRFRCESFVVPEWVGKAGGMLLVPAVILRQPGPGWSAYGLPIVEVACVCLVASAVAGTELARALSARPLVWLGKISYSVYLWHAVLLSQSPRHPLFMLPALVGVSYLSYRFVERPFRRRRRSAIEAPAHSLAGAA